MIQIAVFTLLNTHRSLSLFQGMAAHYLHLSYRLISMLDDYVMFVFNYSSNSSSQDINDM